MTNFDAISNTTAVQIGGIRADSPAAAALVDRGNILTMTQQTEDAVLRPRDAGAWPIALRAALAARIAAHNALPELSERYLRMIEADEFNILADPANDGSTLGLAHVITFMDSVTVQPRDITGSDIRALQEHDVNDADIVRLSELNAFMAYQVRLITGLKLLGEAKS